MLEISLCLEYLLQRVKGKVTETISTKPVPVQGWGVGVVARIDSRESQAADAPARHEHAFRTTLGEVPQSQHGTAATTLGDPNDGSLGVGGQRCEGGNGRGGDLGGRGRETGVNVDFCQR